MSPLRANQAVRMGLRASSRNPELAFGKALLDAGSSLLSLLPIALAALLLSGAAEAQDLLGFLEALVKLRWPVAGALVSAFAISFTLGALFWAGALPVLAADAEMDQRPPAGNFTLLAAAGFARVFTASALAFALTVAQAILSSAAVIAGAVLYLRRPAPLLAALWALALVLAFFGGAFLELVARLLVVRAAALGEGALASFTGALRLFSARLGTLILVSLAFFLLDFIAALCSSTIGAAISGAASLDARQQLLALAPRAALWIASGAVLAWLEVGRQGALAAVAANDAGFLDAPADPDPPAPVPTVLLRPPPVAELVIEALPVEEPIIEALPVPPPPGEPEEK